MGLFAPKLKDGKKDTKTSNFWLGDYWERKLGEGDEIDIFELSKYQRSIGNFVRIVSGKNIPVKFFNNNQGMSATTGEDVFITSKINPETFDSVVGLALHEGSHILLSDFDLLKRLPSMVTTHLNSKMRDVVIKARKLKFVDEQIIQALMILTNIVEDRRIDSFIYRTSPGYTGYYDSLYDRYWNSEEISDMIRSGQARGKENFESYMFYITNIVNPYVQPTDLAGLQEIYNLIDLPNIGRLISTEEVLQVAISIFDTILEYIDPLKKQKEKKGNKGKSSKDGKPSKGDGECQLGDGDGEGSPQPGNNWDDQTEDDEEEKKDKKDQDEKEENEGGEGGEGSNNGPNEDEESEDGGGSGGDEEKEDGEDKDSEDGSGGGGDEDTEEEKDSDGSGGDEDSDEDGDDEKDGDSGDQSGNYGQDTTDEIKENIKKMLGKRGNRKLGKKAAEKLAEALKRQADFINGNIEKESVDTETQEKLEVLSDAAVKMPKIEFNGSYEKLECMVVNKVTDSMLTSNLFNCFTPSYYSSGSSEEDIKKGIVLGKLLGKKLKVRNETRTTTYPRKDTGKINRRLIAELGCGNANVFDQFQVEQYKDALLQISIDASGSMSSYWDQVLKSVSAIVQASKMSGNIDVVITIRGQQPVNGRELPFVAVVYDSRKDSIKRYIKVMSAVSLSSCTPEGLCYEASMNEVFKADGGREQFFLNFSDGMPYFPGANYGGQNAIEQTRTAIKKLRGMGMEIISYYVGGSGHGSDGNDFRRMYGKDAQFIDVTSVIEVSKVMNKKFLMTSK